MTFWAAYRQAALFLLKALLWIACIAVPTLVIIWLWWKGWHVSAGVVAAIAIQVALALQASHRIS
jgi:hypothetical protein